jgi:hypothetical protein
MAATIRITENFERLADAHRSELGPEENLMLEIIAAVREIDQENLFDLMDQLGGKYGSIEQATAAIRTGEAQFGFHK